MGKWESQLLDNGVQNNESKEYARRSNGHEIRPSDCEEAPVEVPLDEQQLVLGESRD